MDISLPATLSFACCCVNLVFTGLSAGIGWSGGWREMRWLSVVYLTAAVFNAFNVAVSLEVADQVITRCSQGSVAVAGVHGASWVLYLSAVEQRQLKAHERLAVVSVLAVTVAALVPGLVISGRVVTHRVDWLGITYFDALPTPFGGVVFIICVSFLLFPFSQCVRRWRQGAPLAWTFTLGLALLIATGINDALVGTGLLNLPYLLDYGFLGLVVASGSSMVHRFVTSSRELDQMKGRLEVLVAERTEQLAQTQAALAQSEKLAAVGNLAAGVAHEINNPTAAVLANLAYLLEPLARGQPLPEDVKDCLEESFTSTKRIGRIVRQLLDAGRVAGGQAGRVAPFSLARAIRSAVANTRPQQHNIEVVVDVPEPLYVLGDEDLLTQVVVNLVANAAQAIGDAKAEGRIELTAVRRDDHVLLSVRDTGPGIPAAAQSHLFEPFFTTKAQGRGTGLGLAVSLGLMRAQGGGLRLLSTSPEGTTFGVELPCAEPPTTNGQASEPVASPRSALRLLLMDDDPVVLDAMRRSLGAWFQVTAVGSVEEALGLLGDPAAFDLALCDVIMPDGGGERLHWLLAERCSPVAERMLFMTAGAVTPAARAFVDRHRTRVLQKPIEPLQLLALATTLTRPDPRSRPQAATQ